MSPFRRRIDERGAVAVFTALILAVVMLIAALVVDIGMQRVARRDMQALADTVSLDMGRLLGNGRTRQQIESGTTGFTPLATAKAQSVSRNAGTVIGDSSKLGVDVYLVALIDDASDSDTAKDNYAQSGGVPTQVSLSAVPTGVVVRAHTSVSFGFGAAFGVTSGSTTRSAVTTQSTPSVCFSVGTKALNLNTDQSALSPLLSGILGVNLGVVGYEGLVDLKEASVPLLGLLAELKVGSVEELASTSVSLGDLVVAAANAASANNDTVTASILEALDIDVLPVNIPLGQILQLQSGTPLSGLSADINVLDLIGAAAVVANGTQGVGLGINNVGVVSVTEPPQIACGTSGVTARSAQIKVRINTDIPTALTGSLPLPTGTTGVKLDAEVQIGRGSATLKAIGCDPLSVDISASTGVVKLLPPPAGVPGQLTLTVSTARLLDLFGPPGILNVLRNAIDGVLTVAGVKNIQLAVKLEAEIGADSDELNIKFPEGAGLPGKITIPKGSLGKLLEIKIPNNAITITSTGVVGLLGSLLGDVLGGLLTGVVQPLVNNAVSPLVTDVVLKPLLGLLGIKLGVTEIDMLGRPACQSVKLIA